MRGTVSARACRTTCSTMASDILATPYGAGGGGVRYCRGGCAVTFSSNEETLSASDGAGSTSSGGASGNTSFSCILSSFKTGWGLVGEALEKGFGVVKIGGGRLCFVAVKKLSFRSCTCLPSLCSTGPVELSVILS